MRVYTVLMSCLMLQAFPLAVPALGNEKLVIEGSRELIKQVLEAQRRNSADYKQGGLEADVEMRIGQSKIASQVSILWNEEGTYWNYQSKEVGPQNTENRRSEVIRNDKFWIFYTPVAKLVQMTETEVFGLHPETKIRPHEAWFHFISEKRTFLELLDPDHLPEVLTKYVIREEENGDITIERHYKAGGYYTFRASPAKNGHVVSFDTVQKEGQGIWRRGRFDWEQNEDGDWYAKEFKSEISIAGTEEKIDWSMNVKVTDFTVAPEIPDGRFAFNSLKLLPGTKIQLYGKDGKEVR